MDTLKGAIFLLVILILSSCADLQRAKIFYSKGKFNSAINELKPLTKRRFPGASYLMGKIYLEKNNEKKALENFLTAYREGFKRAARNIGMIYLDMGNHNEALKWLTIARDNGDLTAEDAYYTLKFEFNRVSKKEMKQLQKEAAENANIAYTLGNFYFNIKKDFDKSQKYYYLAYKQGMIKAGIQLARVFAVNQKYKRALSLLKTIYIKTKDPYVALWIGKVYEKIAESIKYPFCVLSKTNTIEKYFKYQFSLLYRKKMYFKKAMDWFKLSNSVEAKYLYWRMKWKLSDTPCGNFQVIIKFSKAGVKEAVSDLQNLYYSGRCGRYSGKFGSEFKNNMSQLKNKSIQKMSKDKELYQKAISLININKAKAIKYLKNSCSSGNTLAELQLAFMMFDKNPGFYGGIIYYYAKVKHIPRAMFLLSKIYINLKNYNKGVVWLKKAVQLNYIPAARELALLLIKEKRIQEAVSLLEKYAKAKYCFAYIMLGSIYEGNEIKGFENLKQALTYYRKAVANECIEAYFRLARLYFLNGKYPEAARYIKNYLSKTKNQVKGFILASKIYYMLGKMKKSVFYFKKAITEGYIPDINFVKKIIPFTDIKMLTKKPIKPVIAFLIASKFPSFLNLPEEFCLLKYAVAHNIKGSPKLFLKLTILLKSKKQADTLQKALFGNICKKYTENYFFSSILKKYLSSMQR